MTIWDFVRRRADLRQLALALAFPVFFVLISLYLAFNIFVTRFLLIPVALTAPLFGRLFRGRAEIASYLVAASIVGGLVIVHDGTKSLAGPGPAPWHLTQVRALQEAGVPHVAQAEAGLERFVPAHACVGAILGSVRACVPARGEGLRAEGGLPLGRRPAGARGTAEGLFFVVISNGVNRHAAAQFRDAGWKLRLLGRYWILASEPDATTGEC